MTFVVAEIGINHNGDVGIACKMVEMAAIAGADAIKLQNYRTEDFVSDKDTYSYTSGVYRFAKVNMTCLSVMR